MPALNRKMANRKALLRSLTTSLIKHGRIETTLPKAKELQRFAERMVTLGKKGDESAKRRAIMWLYEPKVTIPRLFDEISKRFTDRNGGYTRVYKIGYRKNDKAPMAMIEYLNPQAPESEVGFNIAIRNTAGSQVIDIKKPQFPLYAPPKTSKTPLLESLENSNVLDSFINSNTSPLSDKPKHAEKVSTNSSRILEKLSISNAFKKKDLASIISTEAQALKLFANSNRDKRMEKFLKKNQISQQFQ
ncbi:50S ribosomal protein L17 [Smittium mucronatum]|uniref:50S ribosomal protein L17 n=1 Tax=Smittium mucronatum TaxID=133383 RepID=A0A1R0H3S1_9FUNG|nr:50S ribosomal protein L17 [Smittium mucronatum]